MTCQNEHREPKKYRTGKIKTVGVPKMSSFPTGPKLKFDFYSLEYPLAHCAMVWFFGVNPELIAMLLLIPRL